MKISGVFQMKQFSVAHENCAMRVNTDGCLLGAVAGADIDIDGSYHILDIGTGSGVIALQLAQRFPGSFIDAVEIHGPSAKEATKNFKSSPWPDRMVCYHEPIQEFDTSTQYDLIVSNPPFFEHGPTRADEGVANARHALTLDFKALLEHTSKVLKDTGSFWCVLPFNRLEALIEAGFEEHLFPKHILSISPKGKKSPNRAIVALSKTNSSETVKRDLVIYKSDNSYTEETKTLLEPFYLYL